MAYTATTHKKINAKFFQPHSLIERSLTPSLPRPEPPRSDEFSIVVTDGQNAQVAVLNHVYQTVCGIDAAAPSALQFPSWNRGIGVRIRLCCDEQRLVPQHVLDERAHVRDRQITGDDGPDDRHFDQAENDGHRAPYELHPQSWAGGRTSGHSAYHREDDERGDQ